MVNLDHCIYRDDQMQATSSYILRSQATGSRTIVNHVGVADLTTDEFIGIADKFRDDQDGGETWWHFEVCGSKKTFRSLTHAYSFPLVLRPDAW